MALQFQPYRDDPGQEVRSRWASSLDGIMEAYQRAKQGALAERDRVGTNLMQNGGIDPRQVTPEVYQQAQAPTPQGPALPGQQTPAQQESPIVGLVRAHIEKKRAGEAMGVKKSQTGIDLDLATIDEKKAKAEKDRADASAVPGIKGVKAEGDLRGELQTLSKPFVMVRDSMGRIEAAAKNPSAAGDLALIFNYMKVLDPGSTVREGEFATAQNSAGLPERLRAKYNQVINGERLADDQRADFVGRARDLYRSQAAIQKQQEEQYRGLAGRMGARPENVILDQSLPQSGGPKVGTVKGGYRFKGGNPAEKASWEKVP